MKKYFIISFLAVLVFLTILLIYWNKYERTKSLDIVSNELTSSKSSEKDSDTLDNIRKLYEEFQNNKHISQDAESDFYNSEFY